MTLISQIKADSLTARKARDKVIPKILTTLMGELETKAKRDGSEITDELVIAACKKSIANNRETIEVADAETVVALEIENDVLNKYLPQQLTEGELHDIIYDVYVRKDMDNMGQIMQYLKAEFAGQYDGRMASVVAKRVVSG